jgi:hypothetical protein
MYEDIVQMREPINYSLTDRIHIGLACRSAAAVPAERKLWSELPGINEMELARSSCVQDLLREITLPNP